MTEPLVLTPHGDEVPLEDGEIRLEEARHYRLLIPGTQPLEVRLGALPLPEVGEGGFALSTGHEFGEYRPLTIVWPDDVSTWPVRVRPRAEKLPESLFLTMVSEIEAWLPGVLVGEEGARLGEVGLAGVSLPLLVEALTPLLPQLERAVRVLLRQPRERTRTALEDVRLHQARSVDRETLTWLARHPDAAQWLNPRADGPPLMGQEPMVPQRLAWDTLDHPANRYVAWLLHRVLRVIAAAAADLRARGDALGTDGAWHRARADRLDLGHQRLERLVSRSFLSGLRRQPASEAALLVVVDDPVYARVHRLGRRFLTPMFRFHGDDPDPQRAAVRPSYTLYELWCFLDVVRQLRDCLPGWAWTPTRLDALLDPRGTGAGARMSGRHQDGTVVEVHFNARFPGFLARRSSDQRWSISRERRPDLAVTVRPSQGEGRWVCLDAKYRAGRDNLADAFASAHIYRDALRWDGMGGACRAALLLAPARSEDTAPWFTQAFRDEHGCGVWQLRPGAANGSDLGAWIVATLSRPPGSTRSA